MPEFDAIQLQDLFWGTLLAGAVALSATFDSRARARPVLLWVSMTFLGLAALKHGPLDAVLAGVLIMAACRLQPRWAATIILGLGLLVGVVALTLDAGAVLRREALTVAAAYAVLVGRVKTDPAMSMPLALATISGAGIYFNVPDTEAIAVVLGGLVIVTVATYALPRHVGVTDWLSIVAVVVLLVAAGANGARGRPDSFIGVIGALGALAAEPLALRLRPGTHAHWYVLVPVHVVVVVVASRVAGSASSRGVALTIIGLVFGGLLVVLMALPRRRVAT